MNKLASIIIPTHNRSQQVLACLSSVSQITYPNFEIIVVDNHSNDNTLKEIDRQFPEVKVIPLKENLGAVGGRNEGMRHAKGEFYCFVDSDNIVDKNFLSELISLAESDNTIGFVGPKMYYRSQPERIWCAGVKIDLFTSKTTYIGINEIDRGQFDQIRETDQIPNVWLVKKSVVQKIGYMDPIYFMSYGESDWPFRAHRMKYRILICPSAIVFHDIEVTENTRANIMLRGTPDRIFYFARNRTIFMKKFASPFQFIFFLLIFNNLFLLFNLFVFSTNGRVDLVRAYMRGFFNGLVVSSKVFRFKPAYKV